MALCRRRFVYDPLEIVPRTNTQPLAASRTLRWRRGSRASNRNACRRRCRSVSADENATGRLWLFEASRHSPGQARNRGRARCSPQGSRDSAVGRTVLAGVDRASHGNLLRQQRVVHEPNRKVDQVEKLYLYDQYREPYTTLKSLAGPRSSMSRSMPTRVALEANKAHVYSGELPFNYHESKVQGLRCGLIEGIIW